MRYVEIGSIMTGMAAIVAIAHSVISIEVTLESLLKEVRKSNAKKDR